MSPKESTVAEPEQSLLQAALAGNGRAFSNLVRPHLPVLYRITSRCCGDPELAEDAVQEALVLAYKRLAKLRPDCTFRAFLCGIAAKRARTLLRSETRRRQREKKAAAPEALPTPEQNVAAEALAARIRGALAALPAKRQEAAILRLDAGLGYAEIATLLGSSVDSTRVLVHLAVKDLKAQLGGEL